MFKFVFFSQQVLSDVLDGILGLVNGKLLESLDQRGHDVLVEVLADGKIRVHWLLSLSLLSFSVVCGVYRGGKMEGISNLYREG